VNTETTRDVSTRGARRRRGPLVAVAVALAFVAAACTPAPNGGIDIAVGGTIPLPPIQTGQSAQTVDVLGCHIGYTTPGVSITGASATIPGVNIQLSGVITVPNIKVHLPAIQLLLPGIVVCGQGGQGIPINFPPVNVTATGQLNLGTMQLVISGIVLSTHIDLFGFIIPIDIPVDPITVQL
jgi:hypothetical protein